MVSVLNGTVLGIGRFLELLRPPSVIETQRLVTEMHAKIGVLDARIKVNAELTTQILEHLLP